MKETSFYVLSNALLIKLNCSNEQIEFIKQKLDTGGKK